MSKAEKKGFFERGAGFFEKLHYGLGAAALAGAVVAPEFAAPLTTIGVFEIAHGGLWTVIKKAGVKKPKPA